MTVEKQTETFVSAAAAAEASKIDNEKGILPSTSTDDDVFPEGGFDAWMVVASVFITSMNSFGFANSFGVFQTLYVSTGGPLSGYTPSTISWIGSLQTFFIFFPAIVVGRLADAGYYRALCIGGTVVMVFGLFMTSIAKPGQYYQFFLAQGVCVGLGLCSIFLPPVAAAAHWFKHRRALAMGIGASGSSIGGVLFPVALNHLIPKIGFAWSVRVCAFFILATQLIPIFYTKARLPPRSLKGQQFLDLQVFRDPVYVLVILGLFLAFWGLYTPFYNIELFALANGTSQHLAFYLLPIMNAASTFGRVLPNYVADRYGCLNNMIPCVFLSGVLILIWIVCTSSTSIVIFSVLFGFTSGAFVSLPPAVVGSISHAPEKTGIRVGQVFTIISFATLTGPPIANAIIGPLDTLVPGGGSAMFTGGAAFAGGVVFAGGASLLAARFTYARRVACKV